MLFRYTRHIGALCVAKRYTDPPEDLSGEIAYAVHVIRRKYDTSLQSDLLSAALERLAHALLVFDAKPAADRKRRSAYLRCAMHAEMIDELRRTWRWQSRRAPVEAAHDTYPSPETLLILRETAQL